MFQSGEVDYLVATDAIGMGLNMDVNHVWFASLRKYDGRSSRPLRTVELAQIAGRAGRHMNDGTFGTTADVSGLDPEVVEAIENHRFDPLRDLQWRNSELDFRSVPDADRLAELPVRRMPRSSACANRTISSLCRLWPRSRTFLPRLRSPQRVKLLVGGLPGPRLPQDDDGGAHDAARPALRAPDAGRRATARGLDRQPCEASGTFRRRHRHVDGTHRPRPDLDLYFTSPRLDSAREPLAGTRACHRGQAFRRSASASDATVCR